MTPQVIQFQCSFCHAPLTVPVQLAGVTGPCPKCGQTITSPMPQSSTPAPAFPVPAPAPAPSPVSPPAAVPAGLTLPPMPAPPAEVVPPVSLPPLGPATPAPAPAPAPLSPPPPPATAADLSPLTSLPPRRAPSAEPALHPPVGGVSMPPAPAPQAAPSLSDSDTGLGSTLLTSVLNAERPAAVHAAPTPSPVTPPSPETAASPTPGADAPSEAAVPSETTLPARRSASPRPALPPFPNRPSRGSNLLRLAIAVVMLLGCVGIIGYLAKGTLLDLYHQHLAPLISGEDADTLPDSSASTLTLEQPPGADPESSKPVPQDSPPPPEPPTKTPPKVESLVTAPPPPAPNPASPSAPSTPPSATEPAMTEPTPAPAKPAEVVAKATPVPMDQLPKVGEPPPASGGLTNLMEVPGAGTSTGSSTSALEGTEVPKEAKPAADALVEFLKAESLDAKTRFILGATDPQIKALIDRYYGQAPAEPIEVTNLTYIRHDPNPEVGGGMQCVFSVASKEWTYPIPVMLQQTKDGFKLDWISFIEFKDNWLEKFVQSFRPNPGRFHVGIKRTHYFERDVPDLDGKDCFIIQPPSGHFEVAVFVPKNTPLAEMLKRELTWSTQQAYVLAEIQWREDGTNQWIELTAVPQLNWYITMESSETKSE